MVRWIDHLHAKHLRGSVPAAQVGFPRLASCLPPSLIRDARAVTIDKIPFPPLSAYGLPEFESMANMPMAGITFRDMYVVHPSYSSEGVHFHELVHVIQWSTLDVTEFLLTYAVGIAQYGYIHGPLEAIAFELQTQFEQEAAMPLIVDLVARHAVGARDGAKAVFRAHGLEMGA